MTSAMVDGVLVALRSWQTATPERVAEWQRLRETGLSYEAIARQTGTSYTTVSEWLRGVRTFHPVGEKEEARVRCDRIARESKHLKRCQCCRIILERSGCVGHADDAPTAVYCWVCRDERPLEIEQIENAKREKAEQQAEQQAEAYRARIELRKQRRREAAAARLAEKAADNAA